MRPHLGRVVRVASSITLFLLSIFLLFAIFYIARTEVLPALQNGTLAIETSTMILNRVWDGNELYLLLWAYAVLACGFAYGGIRLLRR